jgi:N-acetylmuramoyl-L-alanine amidase
MCKIIVIDPGHGGTDRKNRGQSGYIEADGVLKLSKYLQCFLNAIGFKVLLTRDDDKTLGLTERAKIANALKADLFISQHTNAGIGSNPACEVFESVNINDDSFADQMSFLISDNLGITNRGGKEWESTKYPGRDYLTVIDTAQRLGIKHVFLVETCNHDVPAGEKILKENKNLMISAIAQGIVISRIFNIELNYSRELVLTTQKLLNNHGYGLKVDGYYGVKTGAAIMDFEEKKKLKLTGIPDLNLLKVLDVKIDNREKTPDEVLNECSVNPAGWQRGDIYLQEHLHELPEELHVFRYTKKLAHNAYYRRK